MADSEMMKSIFQKQKANIYALENGVNSLIKMSSQMTAGQDRDNNQGDIPFDLLDLVKWQVICEAVALVCDERWAKVKELLKDEDNESEKENGDSA